MYLPVYEANYKNCTIFQKFLATLLSVPGREVLVSPGNENSATLKPVSAANTEQLIKQGHKVVS